MPKNEARWVVGLSNGEVIVEGTGKFIESKNEVSPWQKLLLYKTEKKLDINSLQIRIHGRIYSLPSNKPKFGGLVPLDFNYFRKAVADCNSNGSDSELVEKYICIEAIYRDFKIRLWVDEMGFKNSWISIEK